MRVANKGKTFVKKKNTANRTVELLKEILNPTQLRILEQLGTVSDKMMQQKVTNAYQIAMRLSKFEKRTHAQTKMLKDAFLHVLDYGMEQVIELPEILKYYVYFFSLNELIVSYANIENRLKVKTKDETILKDFQMTQDAYCDVYVLDDEPVLTKKVTEDFTQMNMYISSNIQRIYNYLPNVFNGKKLHEELLNTLKEKRKEVQEQFKDTDLRGIEEDFVIYKELLVRLELLKEIDVKHFPKELESEEKIKADLKAIRANTTKTYNLLNKDYKTLLFEGVEL